MPGIRRYYYEKGRKRLRRTPYRYIGVREHDWFNIRKLSEKMNLPIVDAVHLLLVENLKAWNVEPLTEERPAASGRNPS